MSDSGGRACCPGGLWRRAYFFTPFFFFCSLFFFLSPWSPGPLVPWSSGPVVLWSRGPLVPWSLGLLGPIHSNRISSDLRICATPSLISFSACLIFNDLMLYCTGILSILFSIILFFNDEGYLLYIFFINLSRFLPGGCASIAYCSLNIFNKYSALTSSL